MQVFPRDYALAGRRGENARNEKERMTSKRHPLWNMAVMVAARCCRCSGLQRGRSGITRWRRGTAASGRHARHHALRRRSAYLWKVGTPLA